MILKTSSSFADRLRWVREKHGLSLEALGRHLGVGKSYLSLLENRKREKPSGLFVAMICNTYSVREEWLLRGTGKPFEMEYLNRAAAAGTITGGEMPEPITIEERAKSLGEFVAGLLMAGNRTNEALAAALTDVLTNPLVSPSVTIEAARRLSAQLHFYLRTSTAPGGTSKGAPRFKTLNAVLAQGTTARRVYESLLRQSLEEENSSRKLLTEVTPERKTEGMTEMQFLLRRLKRALEGMKKGEVARKDLHVPLPRLSEWLSGRVMPSGETTLRLLHWVEQQERQSNALGSAMNTAKGKTQVGKSYHEKQTQVRKKQ